MGGDYAKGLINGVLDGLDGDFKKKRRRLPKNRMAEVPKFELKDIQGDFELDDDGQFMIVKTNDFKLKDKNGRRVNRRGYLLDIEGNIINRKGKIIFRKDEIDIDDEIPAPYCFDKKKEQLFKVEGVDTYSKRYKLGDYKD